MKRPHIDGWLRPDLTRRFFGNIEHYDRVSGLTVFSLRTVAIGSPGAADELARVYRPRSCLACVIHEPWLGDHTANRSLFRVAIDTAKDPYGQVHYLMRPEYVPRGAAPFLGQGIISQMYQNWRCIRH